VAFFVGLFLLVLLGARPAHAVDLDEWFAQVQAEGSYADAEAPLRGALADPALDPVARGKLHRALGQTLGALGRVDEAYDAFEESCAALVDHPSLAGESAYRAYEVAEAAREPGAAAEWLERAYAGLVDDTSRGSAFAASLLRRLSVARMQDGDLVGARVAIDQAMASCEERDGRSWSLILATSANLAFTERDLARALDHAEQARAHVYATEGYDPMDAVRAEGLVSAVLSSLGRVEEALPIGRTTVALLSEALGPTHPDTAIALSNLAQMLHHVASYDEAYDVAAQASDIYAANDPRSADYVLSRVNLATIARTAGRAQEARWIAEGALRAALDALGPDAPATGRVYAELGTQDYEGGLYPEAEQHLTRALDVATAAGGDSAVIAATLIELGHAVGAQGQHEAQRDAYTRALDLHRAVYGPGSSRVASVLQLLSVASAELGDLEGARRYMDEGLAIDVAALPPGHPFHGVAYGMDSELMRREGRLDEARARAEAGLALLSAGPRGSAYAKVLSHLVDIAVEQGDDDAARAYASELAEVSAALMTALVDGGGERDGLAATVLHQRAVARYVATHGRPEDTEAAYARVLAWKGAARRALVVRREALLVDGDEASQALLTELADVRRRLARAMMANDADPDALDALVLQRTRIERALAARSAAVASAWSDPGLREVQAALDPDTALVDLAYTLRGQTWGVVAFVLTSDGLERVEITQDQEPLVDRITSWRERLVRSVIVSRVDYAGAGVRELLWDPIVPALSGRSRVLVVPLAQTSTIPWAAMPQRSGRYLVEDYLIGYLDRAQDLAPGPVDAKASRSVVVGGVSYGASAEGGLVASMRGGAGFGPLPGTAQEAALVTRRLSRRGPVDVMTGGDPTEAALGRAVEGARFVHVATHGFFVRDGAVEGQDRVRSGLALAGANEASSIDGDDGLWTAEEVAGHDLRSAELVVLSACESGVGIATGGEGVLGLRRALATAGARRVVMSLWAVEDRATTKLMDQMYAGMRARGPLEVAEALREAQLRALAAARAEGGAGAPGTWSAFIVSGPP
jgi:CHAT domain-containing protein